MKTIVLKILFLILSYLVGSIPFGLIIGLIKGKDLRKMGSNNIGATNAGRVLGKKYAVITYVLDMIKGGIFVLLFNFNIINTEYMVLNPMVYGFLATIGHSFSIYLNFKGGKGIACGSGAIAGYNPLLLPVALLIFYIIKKMGKLVSLSSLITTLIMFIIVLVSSFILKDFVSFEFNTSIYNYGHPYNYYSIIFLFLICLLVYLTHIPNIKRLIKKEEKPINY